MVNLGNFNGKSWESPYPRRISMGEFCFMRGHNCVMKFTVKFLNGFHLTSIDGLNFSNKKCIYLIINIVFALTGTSALFFADYILNILLINQDNYGNFLQDSYQNKDLYGFTRKWTLFFICIEATTIIL